MSSQNLNIANSSQAEIVTPGKGSVKANGAAAPAAAPGTGSGQFVAGVGANTIAALLNVMELMMKIANKYGDMLVKQLGAQSQMSIDLGKFSVQQGEDEEKDAQWSGWSQFAGGALSVGTVAGTSISGSGSEANNLDGEITGAKSYREYMDEPSQATKLMKSGGTKDIELEDKTTTITEKDLDAIKNRNGSDHLEKQGGRWTKGKGVDIETSQRESVVQDRKNIDLAKKDPEQIKELKTTYDKKIENLETRRQKLATKAESKTNNLQMLTRSLDSMSTGFGSGFGSSKYKLAQGVDKAQQSTTQGALNAAEGITSQTRSDTSKYLGQSEDVNQLIASISNANKSAG